MAIKCTMLINTSTAPTTGQPIRVGGFSETYYRSGSTIGDDTIGSFADLANLRANFLPVGDTVRYMRFSIVDSPGGGTILRVVNKPGSFGGADVPQMAMQIAAGSSSSGNKRQLELRGVPDTQVSAGELALTSPFKAAVNAYLNQLVANWKFRGRVLNGQTIPIISIAGDGTFLLSAAFTYATGQRVQVLRTTSAGARRRGGFFFVTKTDDTHGVLLGWPYGATVNGKIRLAAIDYFGFQFAGTAVDSAVAIVKKVGRPLSGYRGRKSAKIPV